MTSKQASRTSSRDAVTSIPQMHITQYHAAARRLHLTILVSVAVPFAATRHVDAQRAPVHGVTLDSAVAVSLVRNPDLVMARLHLDSAHAERRIAGALPNPLLSATPSNPTQYAVSLQLDVGPARHYRIKAGDEGVAATGYDQQDARRQIVFAVRQAFYDVLLADSLRSLAADERGVFQRLLDADSARLRSGSVAERDVVATRLQLAHADAVLSRAVVQQHAARLTLQALLGASTPDTSMMIDGALAYRSRPITVDSVLALALTYRPDYLASEVRVTQSSAALSVARASLIPMPVVGAVYQPSQPFTSGSHYAPSVGLTLPLLYAFSGERARAKTSLAASRVATDRARLQIRSEVTLAYDTYLSARALADRYACGLLTDAAAALEGARYAYDRGATGLPDFLEAARTYAETRSDYLTAVHDYWVGLFGLERAAGIDFVDDRHE